MGLALFPKRGTPQAGFHADQRFHAGYRPWRRRFRRMFLLSAPMVAAVVMMPALIWSDWLEFYAGAALGALIGTYACLVDNPPEWIERKRRGRDGERRTARELARLPVTDGWFAVHGVEGFRGDLDHVVVGPPGVFVIETKLFQGEAELTEGKLVMRRGSDERDWWSPAVPIDQTVRGRAYQLRQELAERTGVRWVQGVVAMWCPFEQGRVAHGNVEFMHGGRLEAYLRDLPPRLDEATMASVRETLIAKARSSPGSPALTRR